MQHTNKKNKPISVAKLVRLRYY